MSEASSGTEAEATNGPISVAAAAGRPPTNIARLRVFLTSLFLIALALIWLAMLLGHGGATDQMVFMDIYNLGSARLVRIARIVTLLGAPGTLYALLLIALAAALIRPRHSRDLILFIIVALTGRALDTVQKVTFALPRPKPSFHHVSVRSYAFPSGHSTNSMITYLALALIFTAGRPSRPIAVAVALCLTFIVGISRILLGVHWPSDVVGAWAFGCFWTLGCLWIARARFSQFWGRQRNTNIDFNP